MIHFWPYTLHSRGSLNAVSQRRKFHGALIKVNDGVGCMHPWPEFGDAPIDEQLKLLREGGTSKVIERVLRMAAVDGEARRRGVSLFDGLEIPLSHYSWDQNQPAKPQMQRVINEGWCAIKMKGSVNVGEVLQWLEAWSADFSSLSETMPTEVRAPFLRLDFNSCLTASQFTHFMRAMPLNVREKIDFFEDPFLYDAAAWSVVQQEFGVRLACDKGLIRSEEASPDECGYEVAVLKPGRREWRSIMAGIPPKVRIVMTSAMDHAIGQSFAAWDAAMAWRELGTRMDLCGLCTEHLFEKDAFFERLSSSGGKLSVDRSGTGLGFDDVLDKLKWEEL